jgi:hypothetical protein
VRSPIPRLTELPYQVETYLSYKDIRYTDHVAFAIPTFSKSRCWLEAERFNAVGLERVGEAKFFPSYVDKNLVACRPDGRRMKNLLLRESRGQRGGFERHTVGAESGFRTEQARVLNNAERRIETSAVAAARVQSRGLLICFRFSFGNPYARDPFDIPVYWFETLQSAELRHGT